MRNEWLDGMWKPFGPITFLIDPVPQKNDADWKPEIKLPSVSDYVLLSGLDWDTEYDVLVVAENQRGKSQPGTLNFRTSSEPEATPGEHLFKPPSVPCSPLSHTDAKH